MRRQGFNSVGEELHGVRSTHDRVSIDASKGGLTRQEFAEECDINVLLARYDSTWINMQRAGREPQYFDASEVPDLAQALAVVAHAEDAFMTLPAKARAEFENDPVQFVRFAQDPANIGRMREWGLAAPEKAPDAPMRVEVVNPAPDLPAAPSKP